MPKQRDWQVSDRIRGLSKSDTLLAMRNIELKVRVASFDRVCALLVHHGVPLAESIEQTDTYFGCAQPGARLKLRATSAGVELIGYKRPDLGETRGSDYQRTPIADPAGIGATLGEALGVTATVKKARDVYLIGDTRVHLDTVSKLGRFVELETVLREGVSDAAGRDECHRVAAMLELPLSASVPSGYAELLAARLARL